MEAQIRIIDHKKVLITDAEYAYFKSICREYDRPNFKGEELFVDHFEVNDSGIIIFVRPPNKRYSSMEIYTFLVSLMVNQHLRVGQEQINSLISEARIEFQSLIKKVEEKLKS